MTDRVVWKMELRPDLHTYQVLKGMQPIAVAWQNSPQLWFMVDPDQTESEERTFLLVGTGHRFDKHDATKHVGTMLTPDRAFVFHVFEKIA